MNNRRRPLRSIPLLEGSQEENEELKWDPLEGSSAAEFLKKLKTAGDAFSFSNSAAFQKAAINHRQDDRPRHIRIVVSNTKNLKEDDIKSLVLQADSKLKFLKKVSPNDDGSLSGSFDTYLFSTPPPKNTIIGIVITASKEQLRAGGYGYETNLVDAINGLAGAKIAEKIPGTRNTDILVRREDYIPIKLESKKENAKFGEITVSFDAETNGGVFQHKNPTEAIATILASINADSDTKAKNVAWFQKFLDKATPFFFKGEVDGKLASLINFQGPLVLGQFKSISPSAWNSLKADDEVTSLQPYSIPPAYICAYYAEKGSNYIQINNKGLYFLNWDSNHKPQPGGKDILGLNVTNFFDAVSKIPAKITPQFMTSGGRKVIRLPAELTISKIAASSLSLDNPQDVKKFVEAYDKLCGIESKVNVDTKSSNNPHDKQLKFNFNEHILRLYVQHALLTSK
jgi:hypothetical protein